MLRLNTVLRAAFVLAALIAPGFSPALTLSHNLLAVEVPAAPTVVSYLIFENAEASNPVDIVDFPGGAYQLKRENDRVRINTELGDELRSEDLWVQLEIDGTPIGERVKLESLTLGVTFALGNTLNMDSNTILGLEMPALPGSGTDAANRAYVDSKVATAGDNLGDHTATANIQLGSHWLSGDGGSEGIQVDSDGKVGIGTAPGAANLVVGGVDGLLAKGALGNGSIPAEGKGVRFMWYPKKAALRAGLVDSTQWDDGNIGDTSTAMGYDTTAPSGYETVVGRHNTGYTPAQTDGWDSTDRLFVIGNGDGSPSDAMVVLKSGDTTINGDTAINGKLVVSQLGGGGSQPLCLNGSNALALCPPSSPASSSSSIRYKKEVAPLALGLETVQQLEPVTFTWKKGGDHDLGFIAEEVEEVAPILAFYNDEGTIEGVKYKQLTAVLVNAVKEQQEQIGMQQEQIESLKDIVCADHPEAEMCQ